MSGQVPGGTLDITRFWVTEPTAADTPYEAIPQGGQFTFHARLTGSGSAWDNMKQQNHVFSAKFHMEGIGVSGTERDYNAPNVTLNPSTNSYEIALTITNNNLPAGLYRCGCTVINTNWHGAVAFYEGLVIQIY
jgi:hypothetical protein